MRIWKYYVAMTFFDHGVEPIKRTIFPWTPARYFADPQYIVCGPYHSRAKAKNIRRRIIKLECHAPSNDIYVSRGQTWGELFEPLKEAAAWLTNTILPLLIVFGIAILTVIGAITVMNWLF